MSWSVAYDTNDTEARDRQLREAGENRIPEEVAQFEQAVELVGALIAAGVVGDADTHRVHLTGHANPGHEPTPGEPNGTVTITVTHL